MRKERGVEIANSSLFTRRSSEVLHPVARILMSVIEDKDRFAHEEQEEMNSDLTAIKAKLGIEEIVEYE